MAEAELTQDQLALLDAFEAARDYLSAFKLLTGASHLIDDNLLHFLNGWSREHYARSQFESAATIADLALLVGEQATVPTRIDLCISLGQSLSQLTGREDSAASAYQRAILESEQNETLYRRPLAKVMLAQFLQRANDPEGARRLLESVPKEVLSPQSEADEEVLWTAMRFYALATRDCLFGHGTVLDDAQAERLVDEMLALVPASHVAAIPHRLGLGRSDDIEQRWAIAKAKTSIVVTDFHPGESDFLSFLQGMMEGFAKRNGPGPVPLTATKLPNTSVLTDRVINQFPHFSVFITRSGVRRRPEAASIVVHEFVHYWTFLGSLGGYFSALAAELLLLDSILRHSFSLERGPGKDHWVVSEGQSVANRASALRAVRRLTNFQKKVRLFWQAWRPWAEGLSLFAEIDLDLTESGDILLPITAFLSGLPDYVADIDEDSPYEVEESPESALYRAFASAEALQREVRDKVGGMHRINLYLGTSQGGNESYYFSGYALINTLWRRWTDRAPAFQNTVVFMRAILWLSHSAFDDLVPDWRQTPADFPASLQEALRTFLATLMDVSTERLTDLAEAAGGTGSQTYDAWYFIRDGRTDIHSPRQWDKRMKALYAEISASFWRDPDHYSTETEQAREALLNSMLSASRLHLLGESTCEIRLLDETRHIAIVARSIVGGSSSALSFKLEDDVFERLRNAAASSENGEGRLLQFCLAKHHPVVHEVYLFPLALCFGDTFEVFHLSAIAEGSDLAVTRSDIDQMRAFIETDRQTTRDDLQQMLGGRISLAEAFSPTLDTSDGGQLDLAEWSDAFDVCYLGSVMTGEPSDIDNFRLERLNTLMPPRGANRNALRDALSHLIRRDAPATLDELAKASRTKVDEMDTILNDFQQAGRKLGQEFIGFDGELIRFNGFR